MSDARRYAVWPEPRSRSRSLKGSRPSVPHGTNFLYFIIFLLLIVQLFVDYCVLLHHSDIDCTAASGICWMLHFWEINMETHKYQNLLKPIIVCTCTDCVCAYWVRRWPHPYMIASGHKFMAESYCIGASP